MSDGGDSGDAAEAALIARPADVHAAVLVLNATPGVDLLLTVSRTAQGGARAGAAAALGIAAGCVLHVLAGAFGLAALLAVSATGLRADQVGSARPTWCGWASACCAAPGVHRRAAPLPARRCAVVVGATSAPAC